jgi:hypothetical protein
VGLVQGIRQRDALLLRMRQQDTRLKAVLLSRLFNKKRKKHIFYNFFIIL